MLRSYFTILMSVFLTAKSRTVTSLVTPACGQLLACSTGASSLIAWRSTVLSCLSLFRPPGTLVPDGLMFYCGFFLSFFQCEISELPRSIALKLCHMIGSVFNFIIPVEKFGGPPPPKKWVGAKTCKIWVDFEQFSLERIEISKIGKTYDRQRFLSR